MTIKKYALIICMLTLHGALYSSQSPVKSLILRCSKIGYEYTKIHVLTMLMVLGWETARKKVSSPTLFQYPSPVARNLKLLAPETVPPIINEMRTVINRGELPENRVVILHGPAGTGKTTAVKWLAQQTRCKLLYENGGNISDYKAIKWIIDRATPWQTTFNNVAPFWLKTIVEYTSRTAVRLWPQKAPAHQQKPTIILIDEGDSFFTDPSKLLVTDGLNLYMKLNDNIIWYITTNLRREQIENPNLLEEFKRRIRTELVPLPDLEKQSAIARFYAADYPESSLARDVDFRSMPLEGLSGADIKYAIQHAWAKSFIQAQKSNSDPVINHELLLTSFRERQENRQLSTLLR